MGVLKSAHYFLLLNNRLAWLMIYRTGVRTKHALLGFSKAINKV